MCGIAGFIGSAGMSDKDPAAIVNDMLGLLHSRGPDARHVASCAPFAWLGNTRLRITDPENSDADLPMTGADGRYVLSYNGEIYNFRDLKPQLVRYPFRTESDTEVIIAAYDRWGPACLDRFEGMFAFCLYDRRENKAILAVDPAGQKPLYYLETPLGFFYASDCRALTALCTPEWDTNAIAQAAGIMFIFGAATHIRQIRKLEPGCMMTVTGGKAGAIQRYYRVPLGDQKRADIPAILRDIRGAVDAACARTFDVDVPYAHLLSGGIDSTSVLALARRQNLRLDTFSIGFASDSDDVQFNEFGYSRLVADHLGARHTEIVLTPADYIASLQRWASLASEPHGAPEAASLLALFDAVGARGYRVAFCGSGPDELFDGYGHGSRLADTPYHAMPSAYFRSFNGLGAVNIRRLMPDVDAEQAFAKAVTPYLDLYKDADITSAQRACLLNFHAIYPACEFRQIDLTSMAHSIEVRSPLAERDIIAAAFDFSPALKYRDGIEKWIFKEAVAPLVPDVITRRKKAGFPIAGAIFLSQAFEGLAAPLLESGSGLDRSGMFDMAYLREIWTRPSPEYRGVFYRLYVLNTILERDRT